MYTLLVDDHHLFREGIRLILSQLLPDNEFAHAESCEEALDIQPEPVDLVLLDYHLPGKSEFEAFHAIRNHFYRAAVIIVSGDDNPSTVRHLIAAGAAGYIPKTVSPETLLEALEAVTSGGSWLPPHILEDEPDSAAVNIAEAVASLSPRQRSVLGLAIQGKINKVIADELNIAEGTVKAHLSAAYRTLNVNNRAEAVYAITRNSIKLPGSVDGH